MKAGAAYAEATDRCLKSIRSIQCRDSDARSPGRQEESYGVDLVINPEMGQLSV